VKAYWYTRPDWSEACGNIGDIVSPLLIAHATGQEVEHSTDTGRVLGCGSIVESMHDHDILWGCGLIQPMKLPQRKEVRMPMLRGPMTQAALVQQGYPQAEDAIFGDPCLLLPEIYPRERTHEHMVGVVSHYIEKRESLQKFQGEGFHHIDIVSDPKTFVTEINRCGCIISSSLHGIVIAEAYGIPALRYRLTDGIIGGDFKFMDWYFATGRTINELRHDEPAKILKQAFTAATPFLCDTETIKQSLTTIL